MEHLPDGWSPRPVLGSDIVEMVDRPEHREVVVSDRYFRIILRLFKKHPDSRGLIALPPRASKPSLYYPRRLLFDPAELAVVRDHEHDHDSLRRAGLDWHFHPRQEPYDWSKEPR